MNPTKEFFLWTPDTNRDLEGNSENLNHFKFSDRIRPLILMYKLFGLVSFSYEKSGVRTRLVQNPFGLANVAIKTFLIATTVALWRAEPTHWRRQLDLTIFWLLLGSSAYTEKCLLQAVNAIDKFDVDMYNGQKPPPLHNRLLCLICSVLLAFTAAMHVSLYSHLSEELSSKKTLIQTLNYPIKTPRFTDCLICLVGVVFYVQFIRRFNDLNTRWRKTVAVIPETANQHKLLEKVRILHHDLCRANLSFNYYHGLQFLIFFLSIFSKLVVDLVFFIYLYIPDIKLQCIVYVEHFINLSLFLAISGSLLRVKQRINFEVKKLKLSNLSTKCVNQVLLYLGQIKTDRSEVVANGFAHFDRQFIISIVSSTASALIVIISMGPNIFYLTDADIEDNCC